MTEFNFTRKKLSLSSGKEYAFYSLKALSQRGYGDLSRLPRPVKILLESALRLQEHPAFTPEQVEALCKWAPDSESRELQYMPARILLQDFTGVPCVVDLAALRSAMQRAGKDPARIEPQVPVDLVIDHSIQLDETGTCSALETNINREFERNKERYSFLKWGQQAFDKLRILPPGLGICHQINMEYLADCVTISDGVAHPDTLVGTDSHTTTINCMGVLGWGVGGIEAEAAMLGQPIPILTPEVVGFKMTGELQSETTATDLALTVTNMLRKKGVVGKFVEFYGEGAANLSVAERCPVANMAPEYGATMGFFGIDEKTIAYLRETGRTAEQCELVEKYSREQGLWHNPEIEPEFNDTLELDLANVEPVVAGPRKPHEKLTLPELPKELMQDFPPFDKEAELPNGKRLKDGSIVIASISSCTNTSNPALMMGAGLVAKKAVEKGLAVPDHVRTSLAPGSQVASRYLDESNLSKELDELGFNVTAYGCATCIGNSGPCAPEIDAAIKENDLTVSAVLSGNRNFAGRVYPLTKANYLASPPLVVAYALAGRVNIDLSSESLGTDSEGEEVYLADLWPTKAELEEALEIAQNSSFYREVYGNIHDSNRQWNALEASREAVFEWDPNSTYIREPAFFAECDRPAPALADLKKTKVLGYFGDFITTDHISPAGTIPEENPATAYLLEKNVSKRDFNSFGSRRGNHEVMMRGTFGNIRIKNKLADREGGFTSKDGREISIFDAAREYADEGRDLIVLAGKMYGAGSSRDWAAKGTALLGVKAVIAESFERIHRSNLVGMGVLPLEFLDGETAEKLDLSGEEEFEIQGIGSGLEAGKILTVIADKKQFQVKCRVDTELEIEYLKNGGVLHYVLRKMILD